jgi:hypothetical protein
MKQVILIPKKEKPVEFTHYLNVNEGWTENLPIDDIAKIIYLGNCKTDGDMFAGYNRRGWIRIYKGHLNSGCYE